MKKVVFFVLMVNNIGAFSQGISSNVEIIGDKTQILEATENMIQVSGKLSSGEIIKSGCDHGACYFRIEYKGRIIEQIVGGDIVKMKVYEYDFGGDGDKEIVVINDSKETCSLFVYMYSKGIIQKLFEKEVLYYHTVLRKDYIEFYLPSGLGQIWNYFQGQFWEMTPVDRDKFKLK